MATTTIKTTAAPRGAKTTFEQAAEAASASGETVRENVERAMAAAAEVNAFGKENFEAFMASTTAATKGFEAISQRAVAYSKQAVENHVAATKSMMTAKSVQELVERQSEYARSAFDTYVAELNKMSDLMSGFAKDAMAPLNERATAMGSIMQAGRR